MELLRIDKSVEVFNFTPFPVRQLQKLMEQVFL